MRATPYTAIDYLWQFQRLLPRGRVWHRGWGTLQAEALLTLMPTWARLDAHALDVIDETFPCTTTQLLPEWESTLGLPDPCTGPLPTIQQRTAAVCGAFSARGGQSRDYFVHLASSLGYQIQIETFKPFYASQGRAGEPLYDAAWAYTWRVIVETETTITWFRASISAAGEPLASFGSTLIQCIFADLAPANTVIIWAVRIASSIWDNAASIWDAGDSIWDKGVSP